MVGAPVMVGFTLLAAVISEASSDIAARAVGAACARAKSTDLKEVCSLEAWYSVGAFVKLASSGNTTVRLLSLDALGHVRRESENLKSGRVACRRRHGTSTKRVALVYVGA